LFFVVPVIPVDGLFKGFETLERRADFPRTLDEVLDPNCFNCPKTLKGNLKDRFLVILPDGGEVVLVVDEEEEQNVPKKDKKKNSIKEKTQ